MAKPVTVTINHELGREAAIARIKSGFGQVANVLGTAVTLDERWDDNTMHFTAKVLMQTATGKLIVYDHEVHIELLLPGFLNTIAHTIASRMKKQGTLLLEKK